MAAGAVTLVKKGSTTLGSQFEPSATTDLVFEIVHVTLGETTDWIECGGTSPQTQIVRRPVGAVMMPTEAVAAALVADETNGGVYAAVSGTKLIFTAAGTIADAEFDVLIVGFGT